MTGMQYTVSTTGAVALAAATAKTVLGVWDGSWYTPNLTGFTVAFDGVTASAVPVLIELCQSTFATNPPGTNSTTRSYIQVGGRVTASGSVAASNWTVEPTAMTVVKEYLLTPNGGVLREWFTGGSEAAAGSGWALRLTAPAIVNVRATMTLLRM